MSLVSKVAPNFKAKAVVDEAFEQISLSDYKGKKYVLLFFYPSDFTFVCPTEIVAFSDRIAEFDKRDVQVLGCSVDSHHSHYAWKHLERNKGGIKGIKYPLLSDLNKTIASDYGVLLESEGIALRGLFLIDKKGIVQHELVNNLPLGRSVDEAIRMVDALRFHECHGEVCPAGWKEGDKCIIPDPVKAQDYFQTLA